MKFQNCCILKLNADERNVFFFFEAHKNMFQSILIVIKCDECHENKNLRNCDMF